MGYLLPRGGTIQGFETPNIILGILKYPKIIIGVRGGKCGFFTPEGVRGIPGVSLTKSWGQSKVLNPPLEFRVF